MSLITSLRDAAAKRRAYRDTVFALEGAARRLAEDIDIYPGDERQAARKAVYG